MGETLPEGSSTHFHVGQGNWLVEARVVAKNNFLICLQSLVWMDQLLSVAVRVRAQSVNHHLIFKRVNHHLIFKKIVWGTPNLKPLEVNTSHYLPALKHLIFKGFFALVWKGCKNIITLQRPFDKVFPPPILLLDPVASQTPHWVRRRPCTAPGPLAGSQGPCPGCCSPLHYLSQCLILKFENKFFCRLVLSSLPTSLLATDPR